jgi:3'-phosphoadenosine 5'-phosphosulfate sulfotransferase (PAPS reductase)/FAD synthetase
MSEKITDEINAANALSTSDALAWAFDRFQPRLALACSFQAESSVLIDLIHRQRGADFRVFTLDTGRLNQETYDCMETMRALRHRRRSVFSRRDSSRRDGAAAQHESLLRFHRAAQNVLRHPQGGAAQTGPRRSGCLDVRRSP